MAVPDRSKRQRSRVAADARPARRKRPSDTKVASRLQTLERRVAHLEKLLGAAAPAPAEVAPPAADTGRPRPRCPGCHLEVESVARGRCPWCGFLFDAVASLRKSVRGRQG